VYMLLHFQNVFIKIFLFSPLLKQQIKYSNNLHTLERFSDPALACLCMVVSCLCEFADWVTLQVNWHACVWWFPVCVNLLIEWPCKLIGMPVYGGFLSVWICWLSDPATVYWHARVWWFPVCVNLLIEWPCNSLLACPCMVVSCLCEFADWVTLQQFVGMPVYGGFLSVWICWLSDPATGYFHGYVWWFPETLLIESPAVMALSYWTVKPNMTKKLIKIFKKNIKSINCRSGIKMAKHTMTSHLQPVLGKLLCIRT